MTSRTWIIFAAICVVLFGGLIIFSQKDNIDVSNINQNVIQPASKQSGAIADHVTDDSKSKVILIEYGDFQCPYCGQAYSTLHMLLSDTYKDKIAYVFRNYPLTSMHPNAKAAAAAAEAAGLQDKYWQMHDLLYERQSDWSELAPGDRTDVFKKYAQELGLNVTQFETDMGSKEVAKKINFDVALGKKAKVDGTPTFVINGQTINKYVKDGKVVSSDTQGAGLIWGDKDAFAKYILNPELKKYDIPLPKQ